MTDESSTRGRTTADSESGPGVSASGQSRRRFLQGTALSLAGLAGLGTTVGSADAAGSNHLLVVGNGPGKHEYRIQMESGGRISPATHSGANDTETTDGSGNERIEGTAWHWNLDSYTYSGSIDYVEGDGTLSFHFLDGAFEDDLRLSVDGKASGRHHYSLGTNEGDLNPELGSTESNDTDDGPAATERGGTPDHVSGIAWHTGTDKYTFTNGDAIQWIGIEDGHLRIEPVAPRFVIPEVSL